MWWEAIHTFVTWVYQNHEVYTQPFPYFHRVEQHCLHVFGGPMQQKYCLFTQGPARVHLKLNFFLRLHATKISVANRIKYIFVVKNIKSHPVPSLKGKNCSEEKFLLGITIAITDWMKVPQTAAPDNKRAGVRARPLSPLYSMSR